MKTSVKYFRLAVGPRSSISSQKWPKTCLTYDNTHRKKRNPKSRKFFFIADLPSLLRVWTAL